MFALVLITIFTMRKNYPDVGEADFALELQSLVRSVVRIEKKGLTCKVPWHNVT